MKRIIILFFLLMQCVVFSQEKMNYYFDGFIELKNTTYSDNLSRHRVIYKNSNDENYRLEVFILKDSIYAHLNDYKKSLLIKFSVDESFRVNRDLNKLKNTRLFKNVSYHFERESKNIFEDIEYEADTIRNTTLVHITKYKNKKKRKIIYENYYDFTNNVNIDYASKNSLKIKLLEKYNLLAIKNQNLERSIDLIDGKKYSETEFLKVNNIDYTFTFTIDRILPRYSFGKMWIN